LTLRSVKMHEMNNSGGPAAHYYHYCILLCLWEGSLGLSHSARGAAQRADDNSPRAETIPHPS